MKILVDGMSIGEIKSAGKNRVKFMPTRGPGHYRLSTTMKSNGSCEAVLVRGKEETPIVITDYPKYGILIYEERA